MPNYSGTWDIVDNENFEDYMVALGEYLVAKSKFYIILPTVSFSTFYSIYVFARTLQRYVIINNSDIFMFLFSLLFNNVRRNCIVCMFTKNLEFT